VPGHGGDGAANRLLQVLGYPPVVFLLKVAHGDQACARTYSEFGLGWCPANISGGAVDAEKDECWLPT